MILWRGAGTWCAESSHQLHDESNEVLHLRFRTPAQVREEEEEGALQVQVRDEGDEGDEGAPPLTRVQERGPFFVTHLVSLFRR